MWEGAEKSELRGGAQGEGKRREKTIERARGRVGRRISRLIEIVSEVRTKIVA